VREMQAEIIALCTEMGIEPDKKILNMKSRPSKKDAEEYLADVKQKHISWIQENRRVFERGEARMTRGVNRNRSADEGCDTGTTTTIATNEEGKA